MSSWANVARIEGSQWSVANEDFLGSIDLIFAPTWVRVGKIYKLQVKVSITIPILCFIILGVSFGPTETVSTSILLIIKRE